MERYPTGHIRSVTAQEPKQPSVAFLTARVDGTPVACGAIARHGDDAEASAGM